MIYKLWLLVIVGCVAAATVEKDIGSMIPLPVLNTTLTPPTTTPNPPPPNSTTTATTTTTTPAPITTKPTTPPPNSTTTTTTTPTPPNNTTTSTTEKPTTPTTRATTTTTPPKPTPLPPKPNEPIPGTWSVNYTDTNRTCIVATFAAQIEIPYNISKDVNNTGYVNIQPNVTIANGSCGQLIQSLQIQWKNNLNVTNNVTFTFERKNVNSTKFDLGRIDIAIAADNSSLPGYNGTFLLVERKPLFNTSLQHSYKCFKKQTFNLTNENSNVTAGFIHFQHLQFQAFRNATGTVFADAEDCAPYETPDVVPIAVGCALVALIIIVLVAYLIGRRRNQARGYLSMFNAEKKEADYIPMKNLNCFK